MKKPHILILSTAYAPHWGGAEIAIQKITDRLRGDFAFSMLTPKLDPKDSDTEQVGPISVTRLGRGGRMSKYAFAHKATKEFKRLEKPDMIWAMMASHAGIAASRIKARHPELPYLLTLQSGDSDFFWKLRTGWWKGVFKKVYTRADHIQAISTFLANRAKDYGCARVVSLIPNGVEIEHFKNTGITNTKEIRRRWGAVDGDVVIITTSRLEYKNGIDTLIEACAKLKGSWKLIIAGSGREEGKYKQLASKQGVKDNVTFLGHVDHVELPRFLHASDVFARISRSEGLGNSFIEAMAAGIPVVATPVGGIPDFATHEENALLCQPDSPSECAATLQRLVDDALLREHISKSGVSSISSKYSWDTIGGQMKNIFKTLTT